MLPTSHLGFRLLKPSGRTGTLDVSVRITGYKNSVLDRLGLKEQPSLKQSPMRGSADDDEDVTDKLTFSTDLVLVDDVRISDDGEALFNHPKNQV